VGPWRRTGRRVTREQLITGLLEAAWLRVEHGPVERERSCGPFDMESLGGSAALAGAYLVACERHAHTQELPDENASVEVLLDTQLARHAADAASSLIALARALAYATGQPRAGSREGLGLLLSKAISRDLDTLSFDTPPHGYDDAAESLGRITDALINRPREPRADHHHRPRDRRDRERHRRDRREPSGLARVRRRRGSRGRSRVAPRSRPRQALSPRS
jgi:hypothetical protein